MDIKDSTLVIHMMHKYVLNVHLYTICSWQQYTCMYVWEILGGNNNNNNNNDNIYWGCLMRRDNSCRPHCKHTHIHTLWHARTHLHYTEGKGTAQHAIPSQSEWNRGLLTALEHLNCPVQESTLSMAIHRPRQDMVTGAPQRDRASRVARQQAWKKRWAFTTLNFLNKVVEP